MAESTAVLRSHLDRRSPAPDFHSRGLVVDWDCTPDIVAAVAQVAADTGHAVQAAAVLRKIADSPVVGVRTGFEERRSRYVGCQGADQTFDPVAARIDWTRLAAPQDRCIGPAGLALAGTGHTHLAVHRFGSAAAAGRRNPAAAD